MISLRRPPLPAVAFALVLAACNPEISKISETGPCLDVAWHLAKAAWRRVGGST